MIYPQWICVDCGQKHGKRVPQFHIFTAHINKCDVCGYTKIVSEPRDYGHLKDTWKACAKKIKAL